MTKRFEKNVELWEKSDPKHSILLPYIDCDDYILKEDNLLHKGKYFHDPEGPEQEAEKWFSSLSLQDTTVLYVYGVGLGYYFEPLRNWLRENRKRHVIFLEDDLAVIRRFFETKRAAPLLKHSRAHLYYTFNFEVLFWHFVMEKLEVSALNYYAQEKKKELEEIHHKIVYDSVMKNTAVEEYLRLGAPFFHNYYTNVAKLGNSYLGNSLFGKFEQVPAIICGAGPSLEKNLNVLEGLLDKALVFAGGSAMNVLNAKDITPHFGAGIDPNPMQYDRLKSNIAFEVPYFYRNRLYYEAFDHIHGPRLYITGSGGYEVSGYFDEAFDLPEEDLDEGHNVVNFCVEIATRMKCNPIIFCGVDLAFTDMQAYAKGVLEKRDVTEQELFSVEDFDDLPLERKDIYGEPTYTLWKWIAESDWISDYAREHPTTTFINATEGGLGFKGIENISLKEAKERHLNAAFDLFGRVHGEIQNSALPQITDEKVHELLVELKDSFVRSEKFLLGLLHENKVMLERLKTEEPVSLQTGKAVLYEIELAEEPAYKYILETFNMLYGMVLNYQFRLAKERGKKSELRVAAKKLKFLRNAAKFNALMIKKVLAE